jgi:hypothetical protein
MKNRPNRSSTHLTTGIALLVTAAFALLPNLATAKGGSNSGGGGGGGGGLVKTYEARVTGYVTAIDYVNSTITIGASYYGSGLLKVTANTSISLDNVSCDLDTLGLGDWVEARYDWTTKNATKLSATSVPTS